MNSWTSNNSTELYGIKYWGIPYFHVAENGNLQVTPQGQNGPGTDLYDLVNDLTERGIRLPILIRFPGIIRSRIELLNNCFANSIQEYKYQGKYHGVYPIKVNQQRHVVEEIVEVGKFNRLGLECGSKPELLITLAMMDTPKALIICNGFKDEEYVETALLSQKIGKNTIIVIDRFEELDLVLEASGRLGIRPKIGFRSKLNSQGSGKWVESSGACSKFGLNSSEIVLSLKRLKEARMLDCIELTHFHIGSQIPSIQSIKTSIKEGAHFFAEIYNMGATNLKYLDVGGGLGVDYDGSGKSDSSTNYDEQEYANDAISIIQSVCDEKDAPHPNVVTESGRSLVAHSSVLIFNVLGKNTVANKEIGFSVGSKDAPLVKELEYIYQNLNKHNLNEFYNDLIEKKRDILQLFTYGVLSLEQRAKAEDLYWAAATKMENLAKANKDLQDIYYNLEKLLSDTYFCNFSVFQSLPDSWALKQIFPIMPIHRLNEQPQRNAVLVDLTCDSDGKIEEFIDIDDEGTKKYLEVHDLRENEPYLLGTFLTGAYQEILGDLHNLFGDTDAVHITIDNNGYHVDHVVRGDCVDEVLSYVEYSKPQLVERIRKASENSILKDQLTKHEARLLMKHYEEGLAGYTYLERD